MTPKNLVIGGSGLIGTHLVASLTSAKQDLISTYHSYPISSAIPLDIRQAQEVDRLLSEVRPDIVYLPAAFPNVDYCELHSRETYEINVLGVKHVAEAANTVGARLIYFSSDYIFDGQAGPYRETDIANPISEYGRQKLLAEHHISLNSENYLIIRTTVVYGWEQQGKNFVYRLLKSLRDGISVKVPKDQIGTPTYANDLAQNVIRLAQMKTIGVVNVTGSDCINRYEFARKVARIFKLPQELILPVMTNELHQPAQRPLLAGLVTNKASQLLQTTFASPEEGLKNMYVQDSSL